MSGAIKIKDSFIKGPMKIQKSKIIVFCSLRLRSVRVIVEKQSESVIGNAAK